MTTGDPGFRVLRAVFDPATVATWRAALATLFERNPGVFIDLTGTGVLQVAGPARGLPELAGLLAPTSHARATSHPPPTLGALGRDFLGAASVRLLQDVALLKAPRSPDARIGWHRDYTYSPYLDRPATASIRIALDAEIAAAGAMQVIPGSHRWPPVDLSGTEGFIRDDALARMPPSSRAGGQPVTLELAPGDVTIHHCLTFHASPPNTTDTWRRTLVFHVFDAECRLLPERLPNPELAPFLETDDEGRLVSPLYPELA